MKKDKKNKKRRYLIMGIVGVVVVLAVVFIFRGRAARIAAASEAPQETIILSKSDMTYSLSVSGVVESGDPTNIYSTLSTYPVQEIFVSVGDRVKTGDVLAVLDTANLENDIAQAQLNYENALASAEEEQRTLGNSITNAQTQLEASRISLQRQALNLEKAERDLREAMTDAEEPFDSYKYDLTIEDARISLERKGEDLEKALDDLEEALNDFDDYTYQYTINETRISLERRKADVATAENDLADEREGKNSGASNIPAYQTAAEAARVEYERRRADLDLALSNLAAATTNHEYGLISDADLAKAQEEEAAAQNALAAAYNSLNKANSDLSQATENRNTQRDNAISSAERSLESAKRAQEDAQRAYDKALSDLERARSDAVENYEDSLTRAQNAYDDAQRQYENALNDKERAIDDYIENNETKLTNTQQALADSRNQMQSAQNSVTSSENSLEQTASRPLTSDISIRLQELNLERLNTTLANGTIVATTDGVITELNLKVGAPPSGILFVIEETADLYVSAHVREYNLSSINIGQATNISTDATGNTIYEGEVTYISPKAVSPAGSTSVEFEVKSRLNAPDESIRIGMNAFMDIIMEVRIDVYSVPASMVVTKEDGEYVIAVVDDQIEEIPVTTGLRTSTNTEIAGPGLYDGIELLLDPEGKLSSQDANRPFWMR